MQMRQTQKGFTLVEMAIVLAVIGLILGAIMIGKDVQRNAEYTKIKQKFVDQWVVAYNTHYARTGVPIGDSQTAPRLMVNGAAYTPVLNVISGRDMSTATAPVAICDKGSAPTITPVTTNLELRDLMLRQGIRLPPGRAESFEDRYVYLDTNGNPQEVQICFQWNKPGTASGSGNVMVLTGLTPDLARTLDQMIDGKPDAQEGVFRLQGVANGTPNGPGVEWSGNNTVAYADRATGTAINGTKLDEDQVMTLTAHFKMNQ
jgi:prepilin-type N-terminal cleavage/methylation domain-containing protein